MWLKRRPHKKEIEQSFLANLLKHFSPKKHVCLQNMNHATLLTAKKILFFFFASADRMLLLGM